MNKTVIIRPLEPILVPKDFSWQEWWEQKIKTNFAFFKAIEQGDLEKVKDLLNKRKHKE
jgi:ankyrin repeat protein